MLEVKNDPVISPKRSNAVTLNDAIVRKVEKILNSADSIVDLKICIQGSIGEVPQIRYEITENIRY